MDEFVHLETHSAFSFLWGTSSPEELVNTVYKLGQKAVALTDFSLHGVVRFYKAAVELGIQPIIGAKIRIWDDSHIILLARDFDGYGNLCRLLSIAFEGSSAPRNPLNKQDLFHWAKPLVCIVGIRGSVIHDCFMKGRTELARSAVVELRDLFADPSLFFLAVQNNSHLAEEDFLERQAVFFAADLAGQIDIPLVAVNSATFNSPEDYLIHRAFVAIQKRHHHRSITPLPNDTFYLASREEMAQKTPYSEALDNTIRIAELCKSFSMPLRKLHPPGFQTPQSAAIKLCEISYRELARYQQPVLLSYIRQLEHELTIIKQLKLADYFLLVREIIEFTEKQGIRHSIRGSAAGSLVVSLLLGGVDPIDQNLLFERFINEGRGDMPDIDIDFDSERRDEVIRHVMEKFPKQTAMVSTILSFKARSAVRLTARAMGYPLDEINRLVECLPWSLRGGDLENTLEKLPELKNAPIRNEPTLVRIAAKIVGLPHQSSVHLGGVIIAPKDIKNWTPVGTSPKGLPVGQLDKNDVDVLGLMKLDLLGLRMHTAIRKALEALWRKGVSLDLTRQKLDDKKTYALLSSTASVGIFQLESPGQRNLLGRLQPRRFSDLIAEISLFRPGPVEGNIVDPYVRRRNHQERVSYPHKDLESILAETYGVIVFQEQVLRIVHVFAGLSYAEADAFRRAMTKDRKSRTLELLKHKFINAAHERGYSKRIVENVYTMVAAFASFGFCKAHAASFAHITYQSAFLKAHYPQAFYIGLLNAGQVGSYPPRVLLNEARRLGIPVFGPDINESGLEYKAEDSGIRVPLHVIRGVGPALARRIISDRDRRGKFTSREDFLVRLDPPETIIQRMELAGAFAGIDLSGWSLAREVYNV